MMLKSEVSIPVALATGAIVVAVFDHNAPPVAEVKTIPAGSPGEKLVAGSNRTALITSAAIAGAVSLVAKDEIIFVLGAGLAVALYWVHAYARAVDPGTGALPRGHAERYAVESA